MLQKLDFWIISRAPAMPYLPFIIFPRAKSVENIEAESLLIDMEATLMANSSCELHKNSVKNSIILFCSSMPFQYLQSLCVSSEDKKILSYLNMNFPLFNRQKGGWEFPAFHNTKIDLSPITIFFDISRPRILIIHSRKKLVESSVQDESAAWIIPVE